ncbi:unnamed protein product [Spirodela intermedia]|uniref:Uncharacterized protein n=1 Tax=Spirodela intermedia TaxID=51605 RepID=A0A7I8JFS0_SPIIN|nr:unnamed protein product [Spirodela intermedia]CAA6669028.1 unnamed protein product [Spirodela intermedia]
MIVIPMLRITTRRLSRLRDERVSDDERERMYV